MASTDSIDISASGPPPFSEAAHPAVPDGAGRPLFHLALRAEGECCLVVGGGPVGARKAASLLECGALVTVVAPQVCVALEALQIEHPPDGLSAGPSGDPARGAEQPPDAGGALRIERRPYRAGEAAGYRLVVTATGRPEIDKAVYLDCRQAGVLVNAADDPQSCSFLVPAVLRAGPVSVAVSTGGASPWLAGWVRRRVSTVIGPEVGLLTEIVGLARVKVREAGHSSEGLAWGNLVDRILWPLISAGKPEQARAAAHEWASRVIADGAAAAPDAAVGHTHAGLPAGGGSTPGG